MAYGIYIIELLTAYKAYRARLAADPMGQANYTFAQQERFITREDRLLLRRINAGLETTP